MACLLFAVFTTVIVIAIVITISNFHLKRKLKIVQWSLKDETHPFNQPNRTVRKTICMKMKIKLVEIT